MRGISDYFQGIRQQVDVGLFDGHTIVRGIFAGRAVGEFQDGNIVCHMHPVGIGHEAKFFGGICGISQHCFGHAVGEGIIVDIFLPFVGPDDIVDIVAARSVALYAGSPEFGAFFQHRPASGAQPFLVFGD